MRLVITQLEAEGMVARACDPHDRRSQIVALTDAGRTTLAHTRTERAAALARLIDERLSDADRSVLRAAIPLIERLSAPAR